MNFLCEKENLLEAVNIVLKAVATKSPMPILEGVLINTNDDEIILTTNNLETGIECRIPAIIKEHGTIVIGDAKVFGDIVKKLPNDYISVEVSDNFQTIIKCQKSVYNIIGLNPEEFPELPPIKEKTKIQINSNVLKNIIKQTSFAVSNRFEKPVLTGSLFEIVGNILTIVSLDGFRMAVRREAVISENDEKFIVPGKTLNDIAKILKEDDTPIVIKLTDKYVLFEYENTKILSRLIDGDYFDYKKIIPNDFRVKAYICLSDILCCVERADPIVAVDIIKNPIKLTIDDNILAIDCMTATGKVHDVIEIESCQENIEIGFNQKYLHEALTACECDEIIMEFNGKLNPCIIRHPDNDSFLFMVLPVKIDNEV